MLSVIKSLVVLSILTIAAVYMVGLWIKPAYKPVGREAGKSTVLALGALTLGQIYVAFAALAAVAAALTQDRKNAAGILIFLIVTLPAVGITAMVGSLQLVNISAESCVTFGALIAMVLWKKGARVRYGLADIPAFAVMFVLAFIAARDSSLTNMLRVAVQVSLSLFLPYYIVRKALDSGTNVRVTFVFVVSAAMAVACIAIFESVKVWPMYQAFQYQFGIYGISGVKMRGGMLRAGGPLMNPPLSAALLALCFVATFAARDLFKTTHGHRIVLAIVAAGLFAIQSRAGWLGAVAGCFGVLLSQRGIKGLIGPIAVMGLVGGGVYGAALANERVANLVGFSSDAKNSSEYRDKLYDRGVEIVRQNPGIGQPASAVTQQMQDLRQGEGIIDFVNGYLAVALFSGLTGLALFGGGILAQALASYRARRAARARGWGGLSDMGMGVALCAFAMFPYIPTDGRVILTMLLLFAISNAVASLPAGAVRGPVRREAGSAARQAEPVEQGVPVVA